MSAKGSSNVPKGQMNADSDFVKKHVYKRPPPFAWGPSRLEVFDWCKPNSKGKDRG